MRKISLMLIIFLITIKQTHAANYYWRAAAVSNLFTNVGNWETAPGGGVSPSTAPTATDDVFFPVASTQSTVNFNGGSCRNFNFSAPAAFVFTGTLTALAGNVSSNGNATFGVLGVAANLTTINFTATTNKTINMGTTNLCMFGTFNFAGTTACTYTLGSELNTYGYFTFSAAQGFSTGGNNFTYAGFASTGTGTKTINFSNSRITHIRNSNTITINIGITNLSSSSATTTYNFANAKLYEQNDFTAINGDWQMLVLGTNINLSLDSLVFTASSTGINKHVIDFQGASATPNNITVNVLRFNTGNVNIGNAQGAQNAPLARYSVLNAAKVVFDRSTTVYNYSNTTFNIGAGGLVEPAGTCGKLVFMNTVGVLNINPTPAITTTNTDYYGTIFGGGGVTAATTSNLAFNTGTVTWSGAGTGTTFYWVGGNGNWNDPTEWSIIASGGAPQSASGCLPTLSDDVVFDAASVSPSANYTVTIPFGYDAMCKNIDWSTGGNRGLLAVSGSSTFANSLIINGNADFSGSRRIDAPLLFIGSGSQTLKSGTFAAYRSYYIRFQGTGTYTLQDNLTGNSGNAVHILHRAGTLNANGKTITGAAFSSASSPLIASNTRNLDLSNSTVNIYQSNQNGEGLFYFLDISYLSSANFTNNIINYTSADGQFFLNKGVNSPSYLSTLNFNVVNFNSTGTSNITFNNTGGGAIAATFNADTLNMESSSATLFNTPAYVHNVNVYALGAGNTYTFHANKIFNILTEVTVAGSGACSSPVFINTNTAGTPASLIKAAAPFNINSAVVQDITASASAPLIVASGVDGGGNTNVTVTPGTARIMYWVGNAGNWSDGNHWSIGVSGGAPGTTNPNGCTPTVLDSVVFDNLSFNLANQIVTIDQNVQFTGMLWTAAAGAFTPRLAGSNTFTFKDYGCLEFGRGMTITYNGNIEMAGSRHFFGGNTINTNDVSLNGTMTLNGGGIYELLDSVKSIVGQSAFRLNSGSLYTNGNQIYTSFAQSYTVKSGETLDLTNANLIANVAGPYSSYGFTLQAGSTLITTGSNLYGTEGFSVTNNTGASQSFNNLYMTGAGAGQNNVNTTPTTSAINFNKIAYTNTTVVGNGGTMNGNIVVDTLIFAPQVSYNLTPSGGRNYVVNDTLIAYGTPCASSNIQSTTAGTQANLSIASCNLDLSFVSMKDINFTTCTAAQNKVIGQDNGGNTNATFTAVAALTKLGNDTTIYCKYLPYTQTTTGFGTVPGTTYAWGGGETSNTIPISTTNTYSVTVTYAVGCFLTDSRTVTTSMTPPKALALGKVQSSTTFCTKDGYMSYEGNPGTNTGDTCILAINPNGNTISPTNVVVDNQGNLTQTIPVGTFTNTGTGYYQSSNGVNSIRVSKRLVSVVAPGSYSTNGGVIVRVYYENADTAAMVADAFPGSLPLLYKGWCKNSKHTAQDVVDDMTPLNLTNAVAITPIGYGTENGVKYAEFKLTDFSTIAYFTSSQTTILPVSLISFDAKPNGSIVATKWAVASEQNVKNYELQRSANANSNWVTVATQNSLGNTSSNRNYAANDNSPLIGTGYYRLKINDNDGSYKYSDIKKVTLTAKGLVSITPNPTSGSIIIKAPAGELSSITVIDAVGNTVKKFSGNTTAMQIQLDLSSLTKGVYIIKTESTLQKVVLK